MPTTPREILVQVITDGLTLTGAKWTPETGWTDAPIDRAEISAPPTAPRTIHPKVPSKWFGVEAAYLDGLRLDREALPAYPGPERMAYQAGWVAGKRLQYAARKSSAAGITNGVPLEWWCDEHRVYTVDLLCPMAGAPAFRSEAS